MSDPVVVGMDALLEAIATIDELVDAAPVNPPAKKRRTVKEPTAEMLALIERLSADGLTDEGAWKIRTGDLRCRPSPFASFKMMLPQFRLKTVEAAARAEDVVILYAHMHGEPLENLRNRFRFNADRYLNDAELRASLTALTSLKDLEMFCKARYGTIRGEKGQKTGKNDDRTMRYRRMLADVDGAVRVTNEDELNLETIKGVINTIVTGIEQEEEDARQLKIEKDARRRILQRAAYVPTYDMVCRRIDLAPGLPEALASIVTLGDTLLEIGQIVELLEGAASGLLPVSTVPLQTPPVGAMFIFNRNRTRYKLDGYVWRKEHRHRLNANGRIVNVCYAFTDTGTQRRCYWWGVHALVHYVTYGRRNSAPVPAAVAAPLGSLPRPLYASGVPPDPAPVAALLFPAPVLVGAASSAAFQKSIAAMVHTKAIFRTAGTPMGTAIMRLAAIATDVSTGRDVCAVAVHLSGSKATDDEKLFHFGEIKALILADRWIDALDYVRTVARTL